MRPVIVFDEFDTESVEPETATGTFNLGSGRVSLTFAVLQDIANEEATKTYRRKLEEIRDALSDIIVNPQGIIVR